jgi:hypothetical protein
MAENLDTMHLPLYAEREVFEPENAWPGASGRVVVQVNKMAGGVYQVGYDPELGTHWLRPGNSGAWGDWVEMVAPPDPPVADEEAGRSGEYETSDMTARRGPGRPRKSES